jgi:hypothetical protein
MIKKASSRILALGILSMTFAILLTATPAAAFGTQCGGEQYATPMPGSDAVGDKADTEGICTFCSPPYECKYCNGAWHCVVQGAECCNFWFCSPEEDCIYCMSSFRCRIAGSTCCYNYICGPDEYCYSPQQRCLPR